jgi:hypothetical protein
MYSVLVLPTTEPHALLESILTAYDVFSDNPVTVELRRVPIEVTADQVPLFAVAIVLSVAKGV